MGETGSDDDRSILPEEPLRILRRGSSPKASWSLLGIVLGQFKGAFETSLGALLKSSSGPSGSLGAILEAIEQQKAAAAILTALLEPSELSLGSQLGRFALSGRT